MESTVLPSMRMYANEPSNPAPKLKKSMSKRALFEKQVQSHTPILPFEKEREGNIESMTSLTRPLYCVKFAAYQTSRKQDCQNGKTTTII